MIVKLTIFRVLILVLVVLTNSVWSRRQYTTEDLSKLRQEVRDMFQHAYDGYLNYASDYDELRPLSCDGVDTWGSYSLTLIDALDTLAVMGNYSEFRRVVNILVDKMKFNNDINVSVFETNIRIVGGLLSAHLLSRRAGVELEPGWPCNGPLLRMAEDVAKRLLPAFDTKTGMPFGTVNLEHGVPKGETSVTCTAGVGTFIVEFGALSRLTGDPIYEEVALNALYTLWEHKSPIGLFGNHVDVQTGRWTAQDAGIGAAVDSYYEYLVKGSIMLNRPDLLEMFFQGKKSIDKYLKRDDWYMWVSMNKGQVTLPVFQSLEAYWPGVLSLIGDVTPAMKAMHNYHSVWRQYGFLPEFYSIPSSEAGANRENYPLRPELAESAMYLYRATKDPFLLEIGEDMLRSIQQSAKTPCGYATIKNVRDHRTENRMESFFLAETTKYLYLLFDPDNFIHNNGREGIVFDSANGECIIEAGGYIFNTEAHPIDPSALNCCYNLPRQDIFVDFSIDDYNGDVLMKQENKTQWKTHTCEEKYDILKSSGNISIDLEIVEMGKNSQTLAEEIVAAFTDIQQSGSGDSQGHGDFDIDDILDIFHDSIETIEDFMKNRTILRKLANESKLLKHMKLTKELTTLYELYKQWQTSKANNNLCIAIGLDKIYIKKNYELVEISNTFLQILESYKGGWEVNLTTKHEGIIQIMLETQNSYETEMINETAMVEFTLSFTSSVRNGQLKLVDAMNEFLAYEFHLNMPAANKTTKLNIDLFDYAGDLVSLQKDILNKYKKIEDIMAKHEAYGLDEQMLESAQEVKKSDDLIVYDNTAENGVGSVESAEPDLIAEEMIKPKGPTESNFFKRSTNSEESSYETSANNTLLTDFVQSILKSTMPNNPKFDSQIFLQKIRSVGKYKNVNKNNELLTCAAQTFLQKYSYRSQFL